MTVWMLDQILGWMTTAVLACLDAIFDLITGVLLTTPRVTALPQVQALTGRSVWIVDAVFVLAFVAAGILIMVAGGDEQARYTAKDLLPRLVVGFTAAHFSQLVCGQLIDLTNALTAAVADGYDSDGAFTAIQTHLTAAQDRAVPLLFLVLALIITILIATTAVQLIGRFVALLVLTAIAPLALACHALPQTDPLARLWWRAYTGCLAIPVAQAFFLTAGEQVLLDPATMLPVFGMPADPGGTLNLLVVVVLLWTTVKIPALMARWAGQSGHGTTAMLGAAARVVVVQQLTRTVPGLSTLRRTVR
ncbi:conjugal transfer protein TrbL family protein [Micromonospora sp. NPDC049903]|uniref:conjugal transfer protein TrbL family protein n=1 Tax=Micromonospora sp. NPDC049903 TaxID=3364276 RepID=UPI0037BC90F0